MLKFFSLLKPKQRAEVLDAKRIYAKIMAQARNPVFYTEELVSDSTDGRMEWLSAHLSVIMNVLIQQGDDGTKLSQALYDVMVDDFDVALREEGLTDSGVKRRIKPLAKMFLTRATEYSQALKGDDSDVANLIHSRVLQAQGEAEAPAENLSSYIGQFSSSMSEKNLDQIAQAIFDFPDF